MSIQFVEFTETHRDAVAAFNARLRDGGMTMQFPTSVVPDWLPPADGRHLYQDHYVGVDPSGEVRGGYILKHQHFKIGDSTIGIADLRLPISEGPVNREYASVATELLFDALAKQRLLFGMGIGGYDEPITKLFQAAGWQVFTIPFFFKVRRPFRFCRGIRFLRKTLPRRIVLDLAAFSGAASLGFKSVQAVRRRTQVSPRVRVEQVDQFDDWSDEVWKRSSPDYPMIAVRDCEVLRLLYPGSDERFLRLKVVRDDQLLGWAVVLDTRMRDHKQFGSLRVGSVIDGLSAAKDANVVVAAATMFLERLGVDVIVANHSHAGWGDAFSGAGFLRGPSNYLFASSRALSKRFQNANVTSDQTFINRGDGDGPINL